MAVSATTAPASNWCARRVLTPSISASADDDMRRMKPDTWRSPSSVSRRGVVGPADDGAAPASRARVRNVLDVPTGRFQLSPRHRQPVLADLALLQAVP